MIVSMYLRNALEDFHTRHLSDDQMQELNRSIRQAIYEVVSLIKDDASPHQLRHLAEMIPDYWEVPGEHAASSAAPTIPEL